MPLTDSLASHDPTLFKDAATQPYYIAATDGTLRRAPSLGGPWANAGSVPKAPWTNAVSGGQLCAPAVIQVGSTFFMYYARSNFGTNKLGNRRQDDPDPGRRLELDRSRRADPLRALSPADNTYKVVVGRSRNIAGSYVDKNGVPLAKGGSGIILNRRTARPGVTPTGLYRAPGGEDIFVENGTYYLAYHSYRPRTTLGIRPIDWHDDWPYFNEPDGGAYDFEDGAYYTLVNQDGIISNPNSLQNPVASNRCLTAATGGVIQATCNSSLSSGTSTTPGTASTDRSSSRPTSRSKSRTSTASSAPGSWASIDVTATTRQAT